MSLVKKIGKAIGVFQKGGFHAVAVKIGRNRRASIEQEIYSKTLGKPGPMSSSELGDLGRRIISFQRQPLISIILPVYDVDEIWLRKCIDSVRNQIYDHWELCIADDRSPSPHVAKVLKEYSDLDTRIKVVFRPENGHISAASNSALEIASGEYCVLLDHDDELSADALVWVVDEVNRHPDVAMIYSDEDMIDDAGRRYDPKFKPDLSRDLLYSLNLVTHLSAYRTDILRKIGGFRIGLEGSQDYDLALRFIEQISDKQIRHIPRILYHWRAIPGSVALSGDEKPYAHDRARQAIKEHFDRCGIAADVEATPFNLHRVRYRLPEPPPSVSLIVFGHGDTDDELSKVSWLAHADYPNIDVINTPAGDNLAAALNAAAANANGDVLIFVDASLKPVSSDWVSELVGLALQNGIGAVGGKVIDYRSRVVDGALIIGGNGLVNVAHHGYYSEEPGSMVRNIVTGNFSAVSLSCMAIKRSNMEQAGGFDAQLPDKLIDADLCLRLGEIEKRIVFNPNVEMRLAQGKALLKRSSTKESESSTFASRWKHVIERDPFYNPNLDPEDGQFLIRV